MLSWDSMGCVYSTCKQLSQLGSIASLRPIKGNGAAYSPYGVVPACIWCENVLLGLLPGLELSSLRQRHKFLNRAWIPILSLYRIAGRGVALLPVFFAVESGGCHTIREHTASRNAYFSPRSATCTYPS